MSVWSAPLTDPQSSVLSVIFMAVMKKAGANIILFDWSPSFGVLENMQQLIIKLCEIKMKSSGGVRLKLSCHDKLVNKDGLGWMAYGKKCLDRVQA